mmetsp:Transcript_20830/g.31433  ORF Transcript_20830/g.31433 Transcript_20830/m.31433 type:complete len:188 (-) Transcript_20830:60-623(-)
MPSSVDDEASPPAATPESPLVAAVGATKLVDPIVIAGTGISQATMPRKWPVQEEDIEPGRSFIAGRPRKHVRLKKHCTARVSSEEVHSSPPDCPPNEPQNKEAIGKDLDQSPNNSPDLQEEANEAGRSARARCPKKRGRLRMHWNAGASREEVHSRPPHYPPPNKCPNKEAIGNQHKVVVYDEIIHF